MVRRMLFFFIGLCVVASIAISSTPAQAQSTNSWQAQYFNNTDLSGIPVASAALSNLNLNWGKGAPVGGVGVDNWTARYNTISYFNAGTYRFTIHADDSFRLYIHGAVEIDTFANPQPDKIITKDIVMGAGNAGIQVDYREYVGAAFLNVSWQQLTAVVTPAPANLGGLWQAQFYNNPSFAGTANAVTSYNDLNLNWGNNAPFVGIGIDNWTARFTASPYIVAGRYRFNLNADDAFRLYIQNQLVLDTISDPKPDKWFSVDVTITGGNTPIQIDYREYIGTSFVYFGWQQIQTVTAPTQPQLPSNTPYIVVNTSSLNFRNAASINASILKRLSLGDTYVAIGRTANSNWYQIRVGQTVGWVSASFVNVSNMLQIPVVNAPAVAPQTTGLTLQATANVNIRNGAGIFFRRLGVLPNGASATIIARNNNSSWWYVSYGNTTGWVSGQYIKLPASTNINSIPVR